MAGLERWEAVSRDDVCDCRVQRLTSEAMKALEDVYLMRGGTAQNVSLVPTEISSVDFSLRTGFPNPPDTAVELSVKAMCGPIAITSRIVTTNLKIKYYYGLNNYFNVGSANEDITYSCLCLDFENKPVIQNGDGSTRTEMCNCLKSVIIQMTKEYSK